MTLLRRRMRLGVGRQVSGAVLADQLVQLVATGCGSPQQRPVHQSGQDGQRGTCHLLGRLAAEPAPKDRELGQHLLLLGRKPLPGMVENHAHAAMPLRKVTHRSAQKIQAAFDLLGDFRRR